MATIEDLDTPAVTIQLDRLEANIARVQTMLAERRIANRPHIKTHKIPEIGQMQMAAGAVGITCQKLDEAAVFIDAQIAQDILVAFNIVGRAKTDRLMELSSRVRRLAVIADNEVVVHGLSEAALRHHREVPLLIECDTGFGRNGVQSPEAALSLARFARGMPNIRFEGLLTFPTTGAKEAEFLRRTLELFRAERIPVPIVSGGGTPALLALADFPMVTEHRAGTYVYNDAMTVRSGFATWDDCAMQVLATVVSLPTADRAIIDAGSKVLTHEQFGLEGFGRVVEYPDASLAKISEEHGMIDLSRSTRKPKVGEVVSVIPNHCCVVSNMVDEVHGVRGGAVEVTWAVAARGGVR
jgi:D-serine deaminase-like pyridoxal phosphate-dependent protein